MPRFLLRATRMDCIRNEHIKGTAQVEGLGDKVRDKVEMVWICVQEVLWINWIYDVQNGTARQEERPQWSFIDRTYQGLVWPRRMLEIGWDRKNTPVIRKCLNSTATNKNHVIFTFQTFQPFSPCILFAALSYHLICISVISKFKHTDKCLSVHATKTFFGF